MFIQNIKERLKSLILFCFFISDTNYYFGIKSIVISGCCILGMYAVVKVEILFHISLILRY